MKGPDFHSLWLWPTVTQDGNLVLALIKYLLCASTILDLLFIVSFWAHEAILQMK